MLAMWCCEQPLGQPDILMWMRLVSSSVRSMPSTRSETARLRPIDEVMPSLHESVPGQETTSTTSLTPAAPMPISVSALHTS